MRWWTSLIAMLFLISLCGCNQIPVDDDDDDDDDDDNNDSADDDDATGDDDSADDDDATSDDDDDTGAGPHLVVIPTQLNYGTLCVGQPETTLLRLVNDGNQALNVSGMTHNVSPVNFTEFTGPIAPQEEEVVAFTAGCGNWNSFTGELHVYSNDPATPDKVIPIMLDCDDC